MGRPLKTLCGNLDDGPAIRFMAKSTTRRLTISTVTTLKPAGLSNRGVVTGAASPNKAMKASPSKPKWGFRQKSEPLEPAWGSKLTSGHGGLGSGNSANTGSRPWPPSHQRRSSSQIPAEKSGQPYQAASFFVEVIDVPDNVAPSAFVNAVLCHEQTSVCMEGDTVGLRKPHERLPDYGRPDRSGARRRLP